MNDTEVKKPEEKPVEEKPESKIISLGTKPQDKRKYVKLNLPSRCLSYEDINPETVKIRFLTGSDVEQLINIFAADSYHQNMINLLNGLIKGIDAKLLTAGDAKAILLWEAINSYTPIVPYEFVCSKCKEKNASLDLKNYEKIQLSEDYSKKTEVKLSDNKTVQLRLLNLEDELIAVNVSTTKSEGERTEYILYLARGVVGGNLDENIKLLQNLPAKDITTIERWHDKFSHGPTDIIKQPCKCGTINELNEPVSLLFLFPDIYK